MAKYFYPALGGIEQVARDTVDALAREQQIVLCFSGARCDSTDKHGSVPIVRTGSRTKLFAQEVALGFGRKLNKLVQTFRPHVIHLHVPNPLSSFCVLATLRRRADVRLVVHWHSDITEQRVAYVLYKPIEKKLLARADRIICTSQAYMTSSVPLSRFRHKCIVIPNAISTQQLFVRPMVRGRITELERKNADITVLFIGRHVRYKGLHHLIEAASRLPHINFLIGGSGPLTRNLKRVVARAGMDNVCFLGSLCHEEKVANLYAADIFVLPSISRNEAFGIALGEALFCRTACVCFDIPGSGVSFVNRDGDTGLVVPNTRTDALAGAIRALADRPEVRQEMGRRGHNWILEVLSEHNYRAAIQVLYRGFQTSSGRASPK